ncbi:STN domain-containing protein [Herbaspirillum robiniae]|uniref:STN domain-containing protein n=1 Tax=Herbaspirillum robiniae TaxID=2014887 RepID=UPI00101AE85F|nr:STN domain-containing protein [Herbaspirillum robiniae]
MFGVAAWGATGLVLLALQSPVQGAPPAPGKPARPSPREAIATMRFDIPIQPLSEALNAFDEATGLYGLYTADAIAGRISGEVRGNYTAQAALQRLLAPTELSSYFTAADAYVLERAAAAQPAAQPEPAGQPEDDFQDLLQAAVRAAFCRNPLIAPGSYRVALSLRVSAAGRVEQARLLDTTGSPARDAGIIQTLRELRLARGPTDAGQPFILLILPRAQAAVADCEASP